MKPANHIKKFMHHNNISLHHQTALAFHRSTANALNDRKWKSLISIVCSCDRDATSRCEWLSLALQLKIVETKWNALYVPYDKIILKGETTQLRHYDLLVVYKNR